MHQKLINAYFSNDSKSISKLKKNETTFVIKVLGAIEQVVQTCLEHPILYPFLSLVHSQKKPLESLYDEISNILDQGLEDKVYTIILLDCLCNISTRLGRHKDAQKYLSLMKAFIGEDLSNSLTSLIYKREAYFYWRKEKIEKGSKALKKSFAAYGKKEGEHFLRLKVLSFFYFIELNEIKNAKEELTLIKDLYGLSDQKRAFSFWELHCYYHQRKMDYSAILDTLDLLPSNEISVNSRLILSLKLHCYLETFQSSKTEDALLKESNRKLLGEASYFYFLSKLELYKKNFVQALSFVQSGIKILRDSDPVFLKELIRLMLHVNLCLSGRDKSYRLLVLLDPHQDKRMYVWEWLRLSLLCFNFKSAKENYKVFKDQNSSLSISHRIKSSFELSASMVSQLLFNQSVEEMKKIHPGKKILLGRDTDISRNTTDLIYKNISIDETSTFLGNSDSSKEVRAAIEKYSKLNTTLLISGETGTGKEVVAQEIHMKGGFASEPFLAINCGAISETLLESELFGYVKGAYTGAEKDHDGILIAAGNGTVFLDEVNSMSPKTQAALLRTLESREVRPVGSALSKNFNARIIAASNQSLEDLINQEYFRSDLYYRLARLEIPLLPLRERKEDIPELAKSFIVNFFQSYEISLSKELTDTMCDYSWPGNVRELKNEIERMAIFAGEQKVLDLDLFSKVASKESAPNKKSSSARIDFPELRAGSQERIRKILSFFQSSKEVSRAELLKQIEVSPDTMTKDLRFLEKEGVLEKIQSNKSARASWYCMKSS